MKNKHEVLIGPYRSGKSWALLNRALEHCQSQTNLNHETIIIVPSQRYRRLTEKRIFEKTKGIGLWGLKILTFDQFCQTSLLRAGVFKKTIPLAARSALVAAIGKQLAKAGKIETMAPVINFGGTQAAILALINEWQAAAYSAPLVLKQIQNKEKAGHHIELAQIYSQYEQTLQYSNYVDKHGAMFALIDVLNSKNGLASFAPTDFIVVDGFDRWHILQLKLIQALSKHVPQILVSFDYEQSGDNLLEEYAWKEKSYEQIKEILDRTFQFIPVGAPVSAPACVVDTFYAGDRLAEAAIIAARVKAAIVNNEAQPNEIVVTARNLNIYKPAFEAAFQDAGLEYYLDESIKLETLPINHFLLDLLSLAENDFKRRPVIDCLRSPHFRLSDFGLSAEDVELLNEQSLDDKIKVISGRKQWHVATRGDYRLGSNLSKIFDALTPPKIASAIQYATWVEDLLAKVVDLNSIHDQDIEAINKFRNCLGQLIEQEEVLRSCGYTIERAHLRALVDGSNFYHQHFAELIGKSNFPHPSDDTNKILITGATYVPNQSFKQIYIAGMLEGEFPAHDPGRGFLNPEELAQWQHFGIPVYDPRLEPGFEYALFASLINRAQNKITFSYPAADITSTKEEPVPSFFLSTLDMAKNNSEMILFENFVTSANSHSNALAYCLWHELPIENLSNKHHSLFDFMQKMQKKIAFAQRRTQGANSGNLAEDVANGTIKIDLPEYWSASQLNEYGKCPFSYWVTRALKIAPHAEPETGLLAMEKGNFFHKTLELFYKQVIARQLLINAENEKALRSIFEEAITAGINWLENESWFQPTEFWPQEKQALAFQLRNFFDAEHKRFLKEGGQFIPYMVEAEFGPEPLQPLEISKDGQTVKLRGKIDRIDIGAPDNTDKNASKHLRLVDYKSGTLPSDSDFESGRNIQLPLYAVAAEQAILPGSRAGSYSYLSIRSGKASGEDGAVMRTYLNSLPEKIFQTIENIKKGDFSISPSKPDLCRNCDHNQVCRIKEFPKNLEDSND